MLALLVSSLGQPAQPASQLLSLTHKFEARAPDLAKALVRRRDPRPPSNQRPLVFFHLRKSGGSQVRDALRDATRAHNLNSFIPCYDRVPCESRVVHPAAPDDPQPDSNRLSALRHPGGVPCRCELSLYGRASADPGVGSAEAAWGALAESLGAGASSGAGHGEGAGRGLSQLAWAIPLARGLRQLMPELVRRGTCSSLASRSGCGPAPSSGEHAWPRQRSRSWARRAAARMASRARGRWRRRHHPNIAQS